MRRSKKKWLRRWPRHSDQLIPCVMGDGVYAEGVVMPGPVDARRPFTFTTADPIQPDYGSALIEGVGVNGEPLSEVVRLGAPGERVLSEHAYSTWTLKELILPAKEDSSTATISFGCRNENGCS